MIQTLLGFKDSLVNKIIKVPALVNFSSVGFGVQWLDNKINK